MFGNCNPSSGPKRSASISAASLCAIALPSIVSLRTPLGWTDPGAEPGAPSDGTLAGPWGCTPSGGVGYTPPTGWRSPAVLAFLAGGTVVDFSSFSASRPKRSSSAAAAFKASCFSASRNFRLASSFSSRYCLSRYHLSAKARGSWTPPSSGEQNHSRPISVVEAVRRKTQPGWRECGICNKITENLPSITFLGEKAVKGSIWGKCRGRRNTGHSILRWKKYFGMQRWTGRCSRWIGWDVWKVH